MIVLPDFILKDIVDPWVRENFRRVNEFFQKDAMFRGSWKFIEKEIPQASTNLRITHGLGFKPLDVILTSKIGAGAITFNYDLFTPLEIDVTTSGTCTVRFFVGAYREENARNSR